MSEKLRYIDVCVPDWHNEDFRKEQNGLRYKIERFLYLFSFENIRIFFRDIYCGIKNLIYYFPVIWRDRYWDYEYLLALLQYKLVQMRTGLIKNQIIEQKSLNEIVSNIDYILENIEQYRDAFDIFEDNNQNKLREIKKCTDGAKRNILEKIFIEESIEFENNKWDNIWDELKKHGRKFWD